ncbi:hypothetical protein ACWCXX_21605 [Streptomyces sp. NPDC001732]
MSTLAQEVAVAGASIVVSATGHRYLYLRLVKNVAASIRLRRAGQTAAVALTILVPTGVLAAQYANPARIAWIAWPTFAWVALAAYLVMVFAVLEIPVCLTACALSRCAKSDPDSFAEADRVPMAHHSPSDTTAISAGIADSRPDADGPQMVDRRLVLARSVALLATGTAVATTGYGFHRGLGAPDV